MGKKYSILDKTDISYTESHDISIILCLYLNIFYTKCKIPITKKKIKKITNLKHTSCSSVIFE